VGAGQHVDAVDLVQGEAIDRAPEMAGIYRLRPAGPETLRGKRNPSCSLQRELLDRIPPSGERAEFRT
jgi:hypothetical protein